MDAFLVFTLGGTVKSIRRASPTTAIAVAAVIRIDAFTCHASANRNLLCGGGGLSPPFSETGRVYKFLFAEQQASGLVETSAGG